MKISGHWNYRKSLALSANRMKELNAILLEFCERIEFTATTKKNLNIQFETLDEMISYDNFKGRCLKEIQLVGYKDYQRIFNIRIKDETGNLLHYYNTVECFYNFNNFDDEAVFMSKLKYVLSKSTPSYWLVGKVSFWGTASIFSLFYTILNYLTGNAPNFNMDILSFVLLSIVACSILGTIWLFDNKIFYNIVSAEGKRASAAGVARPRIAEYNAHRGVGMDGNDKQIPINKR